MASPNDLPALKDVFLCVWVGGCGVGHLAAGAGRRIYVDKHFSFFLGGLRYAHGVHKGYTGLHKGCTGNNAWTSTRKTHSKAPTRQISKHKKPNNSRTHSCVHTAPRLALFASRSNGWVAYPALTTLGGASERCKMVGKLPGPGTHKSAGR